jgi:hypothetical protein
MRKRIGGVVLGGLLVLAGVIAVRTNAEPGSTTSPEEALKKAQLDGKYHMLLHQIKVPKDAETTPSLKDLGHQTRREYAGHTDLSPGWWVYNAPYWYIWRDKSSIQRAKRDWGPEQATGEPDTQMAGDIVTAWASASPDGQKEWLMLEFDEFVAATAVLVYETYNPGALYRVTAFKPDGEEVEVWTGTDPTAPDAGMGVSEIPIKINFKTNRVRIYLDSPSVPGWNEIDAVGLRDKNKKVSWAIAAEGSTTYAPAFPDADAAAQIKEDRMDRLEREVRELKAAIEDLKKSLKKDE